MHGEHAKLLKWKPVCLLAVHVLDIAAAIAEDPRLWPGGGETYGLHPGSGLMTDEDFCEGRISLLPFPRVG